MEHKRDQLPIEERSKRKYWKTTGDCVSGYRAGQQSVLDSR